MECLDDNAASEFVSGTLAVGAVTNVERHLAGCRDCRQLVAALAGGDDADSNALTHKHEKLTADETSQVAKRPVLSVGDRVGRYLVLSSIGAGGMGVVFAAYDPQLDRKVALKLLRANLGANAKEARTRLKREAQAIAQLNHPNVVAVYDVGTTDDGDVYIAMEFVEGDTLTHWLKKWPRTWREILDVFHQAARGLMAAHSVGLLHRDFKPDNVLVGGDGRVRVTDFGLARSVFLDDSNRGAVAAQGSGPKPAHGSPLQVDLTATGTVLGTPRYMPPEQLMGPNIDARADQFSYCVALYEALWTQHPLKGSTSVSMLEDDQKAQPPPESKIPPSISRAVMRGLEKDRAKRWPTLSALVHELQPPQQRSPMKFVMFAAVGALVVTGATAAVMTKRQVQVQQPPELGEPTIKVLVDEINKKDAEIKILRKQLQNQITDRKQLEEIQKQLDDASKEVQDLTDQIIVLKAQQVPNGKPVVAHITGTKISEAIETRRERFVNCFNEVSERALATEGAPRNGDMDALIRLVISPSGSIVDNSFTTSGLAYTPSTQVCLRAVVEDIAYPRGSDFIDTKISFAWHKPAGSATGTLTMGAQVISQSPQPPQRNDLNGI